MTKDRGPHSVPKGQANHPEKAHHERLYPWIHSLRGRISSRDHTVGESLFDLQIESFAFWLSFLFVQRLQSHPCCSDSLANLTLHATLTCEQDPEVLEHFHLG